MDDNERIEQIKKRLAANEYFINPHSDVNVRETLSIFFHSSEKRTSASPSLKKNRLSSASKSKNWSSKSKT